MNNNIFIREFTIDDYDSATALWQNVKGVCNCEKCKILHSKERLCTFFSRNPGLSFIAVDDADSVVGTVLCGHDGRTGLIYRLTVSEDCRKIGIGRELVGKSVAALKSEGIITVKIFVLNENEGGNAFWEKIGFNMMNTAVTRECEIGN